MLLYKDGAFLQVLEGRKEDVEQIYQSILLDDRNRGNYIIEKKWIAERNFPNWSMGFRNLDALNPEKVNGYSDFLTKDMRPEDIAKNKDVAVRLLFGFKENLNPA
jgi:hypothetical protein